MPGSKSIIRTCPNGHRYKKRTDCPTCPVCELERKPDDGFLALVGAPARRALEHKGITTLEQLSIYTERELLALHGLGPSTIPTLRGALNAKGLRLRD